MPKYAITFTFDVDDDDQARSARRRLTEITEDAAQASTLIRHFEFDALQRRGDVPFHSWSTIELGLGSEAPKPAQ